MINKYGLNFGGYNLSWIFVVGVFIALAGFIWSNNLSQLTANNQDTPSKPRNQMETIMDQNVLSAVTQKNGKQTGSKNSSESSSSADSNNSNTQDGGYLLALGDSITRGNSPSAAMIGDNPSFSFSTGTDVDSLYLYLKNIGIVTGFANIAVSGARSSDVLANQVPQVAVYNPSHITLLIGCNDILNHWPLATFQSNLSQIADGIKKDGRTVLIGTIPNYVEIRRANLPACEPHLNQDEEVALSSALNQYNSTIASVAVQNGFTLVDLYPYLGQDDISDNDCLHPNIVGQEIIASRFKAAL